VKMGKYSYDDLNAKTVAELRDMCWALGITGVSKTRKDDLIDKLLQMSGPPEKKAPAAAEKPGPDPYKKDGPVSGMTSVLSVNKTGTGFENAILVSCGAASGNFSVVGRSVAQVAGLLKEALNIDTMASGVVNGKAIPESYVLKTGDTLEFLKAAGRKG
jgi:hypothetical protein